MSRQKFALSYDGPEAGPIDVEALSPALLAVGRLIREANAQMNGKKSKTKVVVTGDFESRPTGRLTETLLPPTTDGL